MKCVVCSALMIRSSSTPALLLSQYNCLFHELILDLLILLSSSDIIQCIMQATFEFHITSTMANFFESGFEDSMLFQLICCNLSMESGQLHLNIIAI